VDSPYAAVVPRFVEALRRGESPVIYGDGEQSRDFTHVGDVVDAVLLAGEKDKADGQVLNVGWGKSISVNELLNHLCRIIQVEANTVHEKERPGEVRDSEADIGKAWRLLGYKPKVGMEEGLRETIKQ
jgi:nucleoside-diphosphate-sugar epimerase